MSLTAWLGAAATPRFVRRSLAAVLALHAIVWAVAGLSRGISLVGILGHYDAGWYLGIATRGYAGYAWVYYPLWPILIAGLGRLVPGPLPLVAAGLSLALFVVTVERVFLRPQALACLVPRTRLGWLAFLLAPASYVFHTVHTEALFLLLSMAAFALGARGKWLAAAVLAGLAALTRNQGVPVALGIGWLAYQSAPRDRRLVRFLASGAISGALFALWPAYQYLETGNAFANVAAQVNWTRAEGIGDMLKALVLGNAKAPFEYLTRVRHPYFLAFCAVSIAMLRRREQVPLAVYFLTSMSLMLFQGTVSNFFRYTVPLAPLMFLAGDWLSKRRLGWQLLVLLPTVYFHLELTFNYGIGRWPY